MFAKTVKVITSAALVSMTWSFAHASESLWTTPTAASSRAQLAKRKNDLPQEFRSIEANLAGFKRLLTAHTRGGAFPLRVALPLPYGGFRYFLLEPSTLTPELFDATDPDFLLFKGIAEDDSLTKVQFEYSTSFGITARVLDPKGRWYVSPMGGSGIEKSISYYHSDTGASTERQCGVTDKVTGGVAAPDDPWRRTASAVRDSGDQRHTYAIAVLTAENYENFIYDSGKPDSLESQVYQAVGITLARVAGIFENEFSITFTNSNTDQLALIASDAYDSGSGPSLADITAAINNVIGADEYDVGHLFRAGSNAGVAYLESVCSDNKGGGLTGLVNPIGDPFDVDYFAHELGHQFGANHIHQGCNTNWGTIVEPGSGSTIMGYAGICSPNVQNSADPYFHSVNFEEVRAFVESGRGFSCAEKNPTGNVVPVANAGADYTIPQNTPFLLTGLSAGANNNSVTYSWEQIDNNNPLFRVYNPVSSPSRYLPKLGRTSEFPETLPDTAGTLNFRLTVRDGNGGRAWDDMQVSVSALGSAFDITAVNSSGASADVSWDVDGTNQPPINSTEVTFYLSTDSGASFPTEISHAANEGQATVTFPSGLQTTTARLMLKAKDNLFFSTSTQDFYIDSRGSTDSSIDSSIIWLMTLPSMIEEE